MAGFVDVSNMSDLEIKRLSQRDDDFGEIDPPRGRRYGAPARTNTVLQTGHSVSDVWAAACAAQRVNGGYYKESSYLWDDVSNVNRVVNRRNRDIMMEFLQNPQQLLVEDVEAGEQVRDFLQKDITFRALKSQLTDFDQSVSKCLAVTERFYTVSNRYELAVIAALPNSARRAQERQTAQQRIQFATGGLIGKIGEQVTINVEIIQAFYKKEYNIFFVTGITDQDQVVSFGFKEKFDVGTSVTIRGKVKAHRDNLTQLNYAKVL